MSRSKSKKRKDRSRSSSSSSSSGSSNSKRKRHGSKGKKGGKHRHGKGHGKGHDKGHGHQGHGEQYGGGQQYGGQQYGGQEDKDAQLRNQIDQIFMRYDKDGTGALTENQFAGFFGELCQRLGRAPPQNYDQFIAAAKSIDTNYDGKISKMELFTVFKNSMNY